MHSVDEYCRRQSTDTLILILRAFFDDPSAYTTDIIELIFSILLERHPEDTDILDAWQAFIEIYGNSLE